MAFNFSSLLGITPSTKAEKKGGVSSTNTYNPSASDRVLTLPQYKEHLTDIFASRQADSSQTLLKELFKHDPDVSAAVFSYLTMANTKPLILARDLEGNIDPAATKELQKALKLLTVPTDYTQGFQLKRNLQQLCSEFRHMTLLRGGIATELIVDQALGPTELRMVDLATVQWYEKKPGQYKPIQKVAGGNKEINLDLPTFFVAFFRRDPTEIYTYSTFVSAINTIAARQQIVNDLYRIMQRTGYPRMDITVVEEVLRKNAPQGFDEAQTRTWLSARLNEIRSAFEGLRPDQASIHFDAVEAKILNDKAPGVGIDISSVIEMLNAQNQAGLKTMSTVIGRGAQGVNTSSVEARIAAMNADELNEPLSEILTNICSYLLHQSGFEGFADVSFEKCEMRPDLELEPQLVMRTQRLRQDLSDGLITDIEYALWVHGRLPEDGAPQLSGTGFATPVPAGEDTAANGKTPSPNSDPLGRSIAAPGSKMAKSKAVK